MLAASFGTFVVGVIIAAFGAVVVLSAAWSIVENLKMRSRATGTIVATAIGGDGETHAVVEFRTDDNTRARFTNEATAYRKLSIGRSVRVRHDPRDHRHARIATFFASWNGPLLQLLAGSGLFVYGLSIVSRGE